MSIAAEALRFVTKLQALDCKPAVVQMEIGGRCYTSTKLPATVALELFPRVVSMLGAGTCRMLAIGEAPDEETIVHLVAGVADRAARDGLAPLVKDLLSQVKCSRLRSSGEGGLVLNDFDSHFAGELGHLLKVCVFVIAHNLRGPTYGDPESGGRRNQNEAEPNPDTGESSP